MLRQPTKNNICVIFGCILVKCYIVFAFGVSCKTERLCRDSTQPQSVEKVFLLLIFLNFSVYHTLCRGDNRGEGTKESPCYSSGNSTFTIKIGIFPCPTVFSPTIPLSVTPPLLPILKELLAMRDFYFIHSSPQERMYCAIPPGYIPFSPRSPAPVRRSSTLQRVPPFPWGYP